MNNVASFDMMALAAAAKKASEVISQLKDSRENLDLSPIQSCGHMMRKLLTKEAAALSRLTVRDKDKLVFAVSEVDPDLNTADKIRQFIGEVVGTTRNIATVSDEKAIKRAHMFLSKLAS